MPRDINGADEGYMNMQGSPAATTSRLYSGFMLFLIGIVFLLSHSNQKSSQSMGTLLLLVSPFLLLIKPGQPLADSVRFFMAVSAAMFIYSLLVFFDNPVSKTSWSTMRGLTYYLLAPVAVYTLWLRPLSRKAVFWLLLTATILALFPVVREAMTRAVRGDSAAHPIFWGNFCLTTGVMVFILSRDRLLMIRWKYWLGLAGLAMGLTASFWSLTRGGWITIPLVIIALAALRIISIKELLLILIAAAVIFMSSDRIQNRLLKTIQMTDSGLKLDASTQARIDMWKVASDAFLEKPLTGNGLDAFARQVDEQRKAGTIKFRFEHAHNELMEVLASRGIIGLAILLTLIAGLLVIYWRHRHSIYAIAGLISTSQYVIYSASEVFFTFKYTITYFVLLQSILLVSCLRHPGGKEAPDEQH